MDELKFVAGDLFPNTYWIDGYKKSIVNTNFHTSHTKLSDSIKSA